MPLTLGNECSGVIEKVGKKVVDFQPGDSVYARLLVAKGPLNGKVIIQL